MLHTNPSARVCYSVSSGCAACKAQWDAARPSRMHQGPVRCSGVIEAIGVAERTAENSSTHTRSQKHLLSACRLTRGQEPSSSLFEPTP
eukprot:352749-Chlamydomonas_euryale.AAC.4